ncbi:ABC transporter ATP-binding protein [Arachidicoccus ginsenosidimutans]|uniref:ABC transporter ATP-binding protein n=1 Tax=Arachidicoccus sp. BS20 TaxID=1850526 RepID=UPI0007F071EB|nr:ABC transporter ATP-binding protein [Arachidicoccus sp. BS20]ANI88678.1 ABC transporter ATP-binding protein [Arachidicoccus sp. BS20]
MENPIIQLDGLTKFYGSLKAVDDLSLSINKGEIFGLLGPNGAGKSTTILMMLGLTEPSSGEAHICGYKATQNPLSVKQKVGYMPDSVGFYDNLSALENLVYIGRLNGIAENDVQRRAKEMLHQVGLADDMHKKTGAFSRGMKQRLGLADVLIKQPEVIILDEPTLGIDPSGVKEFLTLIKQMSRQQGLTVLLSSHHLHQVQQVCDRVGIFVNGKLLAEGNIDTLGRNLFTSEPYVVNISVKNDLTDASQLNDTLTKLPEVKKTLVTENNAIDIFCGEDITPQLVRTLVQQGFDITGVQKRVYGLDEIYQRYFENNLKEHLQNEKRDNLFKRTFGKRNKK